MRILALERKLAFGPVTHLSNSVSSANEYSLVINEICIGNVNLDEKGESNNNTGE